MVDFEIKPLERKHVRAAFACSNEKINNFVKNNALRDHNAYKIRVSVAVEVGKNDVLGFYSLCLTSLEPAKVSKESEKKYARVKATPAIYLAMTAVTQEFEGCGIGSGLLRHAFDTCLLIAEHAGAYCIALDAVSDERAASYESKFGFQRFVDGDLKMFLALSTLRTAIK